MKKNVSDDDLFNLEKKVALVTGASSGIGLHLCQMLLGRGCLVAGASRTASQSSALRSLAEKYGKAFLAVDMDVSHESNVEKAFDEITDVFENIDIVINNAGTAVPKRAADTSQEEWSAVVDTNLTGPFLVSRVAAKYMPNGGSIIQISSIGAVKAFVGLSAYSSSKAGLIMLARTLALELAPQSIRVNTVAPGYIFTPMNEEFLSGPAGDKIRRQIPAGRFGQTGDLDGAIVFLASAASSYVTGACLHVNGGWDVV